MELRFRRVEWEFASVFRIAYRTRTHAQTVVAELQEEGWTGRAEAAGVSYNGETVDMLLEQFASVAGDLRNGLTREDLQSSLPAGGARNALDCAMWDLEAKRSGRRAWELAGLPAVKPLATAFTLSADSAAAMARAATAARQHSRLKLKLTGEGDIERVRAVREARPDVALIVDANQAWSERQLRELVSPLAALGVQLIEQPLAVGKDDALAGFDSPVPLCADESCQTTESLLALAGKYRYINIKLDKTGGLTEALRLAQAARAAGFDLMVGCMGGSSLSIAPAFVIGQFCNVVDLDAPLLMKSDIPDGIHYEGSRMSVPSAELWG
jgi:L-Ala-D/L-Glu epimerase